MSEGKSLFAVFAAIIAAGWIWTGLFHLIPLSNDLFWWSLPWAFTVLLAGWAGGWFAYILMVLCIDLFFPEK